MRQIEAFRQRQTWPRPIHSLALLPPRTHHQSRKKLVSQKKKGPGQTPKRKRKRPSREDQDEDPYMKGICDMWRLSMEKQSERFEKSMELQQAAIQSQTEQTKALVGGLKIILNDCLKSD